MKTITLNIPDDQRIGEAIYEAIRADRESKEILWKFAHPGETGSVLHKIEDQDLLYLLQKTQ